MRAHSLNRMPRRKRLGMHEAPALCAARPLCLCTRAHALLKETSCACTYCMAHRPCHPAHLRAALVSVCTTNPFIPWHGVACASCAGSLAPWLAGWLAQHDCTQAQAQQPSGGRSNLRTRREQKSARQPLQQNQKLPQPWMQPSVGPQHRFSSWMSSCRLSQPVVLRREGREEKGTEAGHNKI